MQLAEGPGFKTLFGIHGTLTVKEFLIAAGLSISTLPVFEAGKAIQRRARKKGSSDGIG